MQAATGRVITYRYAVLGEDGTVHARSPEDDPQRTLLGHGDELQAVTARLEGTRAGDHLAFTLPPEQAFGAHDPERVVKLPRSHWDAADPVLAPVVLTLTEPDGTQRTLSGEITAFDDDEVLLDQNHPLAGHTLRFELDVLGVRDATPDEAQALRPLPFPLDVLAARDFPGAIGDQMRQFATASMSPPYPWGHWQVARLVEARLADLDGDLIELGVGLGGMSMLLGSLVQEAGRTVYALDTFDGLPAPDPARDNPYFLEGLYRGRTPLRERVAAALERHALDEVVQPIAGDFADTLPTLPPDARFVLAHLDSDLYRSVRVSLEGVWDRMVDGGVVILDDFFHPAQGPARACADFFRERGLRPTYHLLFPYAVYVVKGDPTPSRWRRSVDGNTYALDHLRSDALLVQAVAESAARCVPGTRKHANAARLLGLLRAEDDRNADVYDYLAALEDLWDGIAAGFSEATPI